MSPLQPVSLFLSIGLTAVLGVAQASGQPISQDAGCDDPFDGVEQLGFSTSGWSTDFCRHSVAFEEIVSGGPPRDGIPPIDEPEYVSVAEASTWIGGREPVILLVVDGDARAFPIQILTWHEVVNAEVGRKPVAVTFCPLCYAAIVFERPTVDNTVLTFGTTGNLRKSDLVMWDRETESWWQQFSGESIVGRLTGTKLAKLPASLVSWNDFKTHYPDGKVLSKNTGHRRAYGDNPYVGYDDVGKTPWLYDGPVGDQLRPMDRVVGLELGAESRAYELSTLRKRRVWNDRVGDRPVVIFWQKGAASALDSRSIADGRDIGTTGVFRATADGLALTFAPHGKARFKDDQTGSTWNGLGESTAGPLSGTRLEPLVHHNVFWFVWSAFKPDGALVK